MRTNGLAVYMAGMSVSNIAMAMQALYPKAGSIISAVKKTSIPPVITEGNDRFVYDTADTRYLIICIPVSRRQSRTLDSVIAERLNAAPYDYAFIGMRCASAAYELLAAANIYPARSINAMVWKYFYPRKLRKSMLKDARAKKWTMISRPGRKTRKWERD